MLEGKVFQIFEILAVSMHFMQKVINSCTQGVVLKIFSKFYWLNLAFYGKNYSRIIYRRPIFPPIVLKIRRKVLFLLIIVYLSQ